jgi:hypothetical protein
MASGSTAERAKHFRTSRWAHVIERIGLAMAGASCGVYVAAYVSNTGIGVLSPFEFVFAMIAYGSLGFYLGIDIPPPPRSCQLDLSEATAVQKADPTELLSAAGIFVAAAAALVSVYLIALDAPLRPT